MVRIERILAAFLRIHNDILSPSDVPTTRHFIMDRLTKVDQAVTKFANEGITSVLQLSSDKETNYSDAFQSLLPSPV